MAKNPLAAAPALSLLGPDLMKSVAHLRKSLGLTRADFARMAGMSERSLASFEASGDLTPKSQRALNEACQLCDALLEMSSDAKAIGQWLNTPVEVFAGSTPLQVLERGEAAKLWRMIYRLESGGLG